MSKEPLINADQLAEAVGVTRWTVYRWVRHGLIPYYRMGGRLKFRLSEVLEYTRIEPAEKRLAREWKWEDYYSLNEDQRNQLFRANKRLG